jgi:hypothetical protein
VVVTVTTASSVMSVTGSSISTTCTNGSTNCNAWVGQQVGSTINASPTRNLADMTCISATAPGNFGDLCSFSCLNGYCPYEACHCLEFGYNPTPAQPTGTPGFPLANGSALYSGLCNFDCNHGYCPEDACGYADVSLSTPTVSPFTPDACTGGTDGPGGQSYSILCSYTCSFGYCPINVCTCTSTGVLNVPPATINDYDYYTLDGSDDEGMCNFACQRESDCPAPCGGGFSGSGGAGAGDGIVFIGESIWGETNPEAFCNPDCTLILPNYTLPNPLTVSPTPEVLNLTMPLITTVAVTTVVIFESTPTKVTFSATSSTGAPLVITTTYTPSAIVIGQVRFYPITVSSGSTTSGVSTARPYIVPPTQTITVIAGSTTYSWKYTPPVSQITSPSISVPHITVKQGAPSPTCDSGCGSLPPGSGPTGSKNPSCLSRCGYDKICLQSCVETIDYPTCDNVCGLLDFLCKAVCVEIEDIISGTDTIGPLPNCYEACFAEESCVETCQALELIYSADCQSSGTCAVSPTNSDGGDGGDGGEDGGEDGDEPYVCAFDPDSLSNSDPLDIFPDGSEGSNEIPLNTSYMIPLPSTTQSLMPHPISTVVILATPGSPNAPAPPINTPSKPPPNYNPAPPGPQWNSGQVTCAAEDAYPQPLGFYDLLVYDACGAFVNASATIMSGQSVLYVGENPGNLPSGYPSEDVRIYSMVWASAINDCQVPLTLDDCLLSYSEVLHLCGGSAGDTAYGGYYQNNCIMFFIGLDDSDIAYSPGQLYSGSEVLLGSELPYATLNTTYVF